jgi:hypothetical protein
MNNNNVCIGGIDLEQRLSVRLLTAQGYHEPLDKCPYNIRDVWDIEYNRTNKRPLPHSEDVCVVSRNKVSVLRKDITMLSYLDIIRYPIYNGSIFATYDGKLKSSREGSLFISADNVPTYSTCFYISDVNMQQHTNPADNRIYYYFSVSLDPFADYRIPYVGTEISISKIIPKGTLIRLSLANWWQNEFMSEKRCYLQLSGAYM